MFGNPGGVGYSEVSLTSSLLSLGSTPEEPVALRCSSGGGAERKQMADGDAFVLQDASRRQQEGASKVVARRFTAETLAAATCCPRGDAAEASDSVLI